VDEISQPLSRVRVAVTLLAGHVKRSLSQEGLRGWRHVGKVVHHHKHLDHGAQRVEESELQGALFRHPVSFLSKVDMTQIGRGHRGVFTEGVEEDSDGEGEMARLEGARCPNFRCEASTVETGSNRPFRTDSSKVPQQVVPGYGSRSRGGKKLLRISLFLLWTPAL